MAQVGKERALEGSESCSEEPNNGNSAAEAGLTMADTANPAPKIVAMALWLLKIAQMMGFSGGEDEMIVRAHASFGNKRATIARLLNGRIDNAIKNHWNSMLKRRTNGGFDGSDERWGQVLKWLESGDVTVSMFSMCLNANSQIGSEVSDSRNLVTLLVDMNVGNLPIMQLVVESSPPILMESPTTLTLYLPGTGSQVYEIHNEMPPRAEACVGLAKFSDEIFSVMQEMIKKEVRDYLEGEDDGGGVRNAGLKRIGLGKMDLNLSACQSKIGIP
ncbi:hypothetical protein RJ639_010473 [Escallonia herrerae]|uniref:HTH myb-type domain-containing protein n=1 Tax=Escallonia herrerae TaxID=1293975 RepID=A0AA88VQS2_9ASTE|nr:hypothetical protein RJ639_010473 [Escallonia herrerae]